MSKLQLYKDDFVLLLETGFIAAGQSDEDSASKLFKSAQLLDPQNMLPKVGFGYIHLLKLELKKAAYCFEEILTIEPDNQMAKTLLGLALSLHAKEVAKGEKLLEEVLEETEDTSISKVAATTLDFIDRFVKKQPTPLEGVPKKSSKKGSKK
ncbi:tetratricopeptide repeat protein [Rhabdochlamydiaceae symbiont of Dictyostelium giganteum]|uniref:tetratricopeptide repeat protein n=1 Tax=Rhabdochlamydiaceae symbiont of Dictyostelium giganteum TaxID=3342349 RepID=UPI00384B5F56